MTLTEAALRSVIRHEGGFQNHPNDRGNWTTGRVGEGELKGTKYGITAMTYPDLDIPNLTVDDAIAIYERDWVPAIPTTLVDGEWWFALDTAINSGVGRMRAIINEDPTLLGQAALRLQFLARLDAWATFGRGWVNRVAGVLTDINAWERQHGQAGIANVLVLHDFPFGTRVRHLFTRELVQRERHVWRTRARADGVRLDVRRE